MNELILQPPETNAAEDQLSGTGLSRRRLIGAALSSGALALGSVTLAGCAGGYGWSLEDAVRRLLYLSSERAFARLLVDGGYWDEAIGTLGLNAFMGNRGDILGRILTSGVFKDRLEYAFAKVAVDAAESAAPVVTDAVRVIGLSNALALVNGGPRAATGFLRGSMGETLVEAMVPEVGDALRISREPLVGELLASLTGVDVSRVANGFAGEVDDVIWREIGNEEAAIRADPRSTNDSVIIGVFGGAAAL